MNFKNFVQDFSTGIYVYCNYTSLCCSLLKDWVESVGIFSPVNAIDYHSTITYSRKYIPNIESVLKNNQPKSWFFKPTRFALLGKDCEKNIKALVLLIEAPQLINLHNEIIKLGATHDFPDYTPHITLTYNAPANYDFSKLTIPNITMTVKSIFFEPLNENA